MPKSKTNQSTQPVSNLWWRRFPGLASSALLACGLLFFSGCAAITGEATPPPKMQTPTWTKVPTEAVFYVDEKGIQATTEIGKPLLLAKDALSGGMISDDKLVYEMSEDERTTVWQLDIGTGSKEVLFSLSGPIEQFLPSPAGERFVFVTDEHIYGWSGDGLQKISKGLGAHWSPNGSAVLIQKGKSLLVSDISKEGDYSETVVVADGIGGPMTFVSEASVLFQKTLPAVEGEEGAEAQKVFTISTFQGETTDEFPALLPPNSLVLDQVGGYLLMYNPEAQETVVLSLQKKEFILNLTQVKEAQFSTGGDTVQYIQNDGLYEIPLTGGKSRRLTDSANKLIPNP